MRAQEASTTTTQALSFANLLNTGETLASITGIVTNPSVTVNNSAINGDSDGVTFDFTGTAPLNYKVTATVVTDAPRTLIKSAWVRVLQDGELAYYPRIIDVLHALRVALDDAGENRGAPSAGYSYSWEEFDTDLLWKNADLIVYWNAIARRFARQRPIDDKAHTPAITQITLTASQSEYILSPAILEIHRAKLSSQDIVMQRKSRDFLDRHWGAWDSGTGTPDTYLHEGSTLTVTPTPTATDTLTLWVKRYPLELPLLWEDRNTYLIDPDPQWQEALIHGMKFLAYQKSETDTAAPEMAQAEREMFNSLVGPEVSAQAQKDRAFFANHDVEVISY